MQVDDAVVRVEAVLHLNPMTKRTEVVAEVDLAGRLDS